uniref:Uncharacterized protein n=1 Tax=Glossina palpalis gambiensis TaxID=67801 RepID=A0A1B0C265_9MUSC
MDEKMQTCTLAEHKTPYCDKCIYATKNSSAMVFKVLHFGGTIQTFPIQPKAKPSSTFSSRLLQTSSGEAF